MQIEIIREGYANIARTCIINYSEALAAFNYKELPDDYYWPESKPWIKTYPIGDKLYPLTTHSLLALNHMLVKMYGGYHQNHHYGNNVRSMDALKSAIAAPFYTFDGIELAPTNEDKIVRLGSEIIFQHPFLDGNKRTAMIIMLTLGLALNLNVDKDQKNVYDNIMWSAETSDPLHLFNIFKGDKIV